MVATNKGKDITMAGFVWRAQGAAVLLAALAVIAPDLSWAHEGEHEKAAAQSAGTFAAGEPGDAAKPFRVIDLRMLEGDGKMNYSAAKVDVKLGEQIKFMLTNTGALDHEFMLDSIEHNAKHKIAMAKNPEMIHDDPNGKRLQPNGSSEILWRFTKSGTFEFACLIPGHYEAGMHGVVVVAAGK